MTKQEEMVGMLHELHQAVIGIPDSDERGLIGDVKEIRKDLKSFNGRLHANEVRSKVNQAVIALMLGGAGTGVTKLLGLW